ncbi:glycerophosphodiester phosphodiesterase [Gordonia alkanivorans]|uniref:glycerophosphodiester phosphodiesterase n=1 Tax=Gordonia alkanivorans TaxID=84096 RepID=UPI00244D3238|nr:glycerophosphodiester phosphodiesterase family protein [Gordonia alkanivorans]MDH3011151.1 glycerophosphodiester phosphodiesterase family protein [Gordonia alkanivorans]
MSQTSTPSAPDPARPPLYVDFDGHRTMLKWHRGRRRADDPAFTASRIIEGMRLGASIEVDLVIHADRGFAVLHDRVVDHATTGTGAISALPAAYLRGLSLRDNHGKALDEPVLLLEDLTELFSTVDIAPSSILQLDFKEDDAALDPRAVHTFARSVEPLASHYILSCGDAAAVARLTSAAPGIRVGYDPCHHGAADAAIRSGDFEGFVARALAASPNAEMVYLENRLILAADRRSVDLVDAFHRHDRLVDGYTVTRVGPRSVPDIRRLLELRVDQITTDDPEGLAALDLDAAADAGGSRLVRWVRRTGRRGPSDV